VGVPDYTGTTDKALSQGYGTHSETINPAPFLTLHQATSFKSGQQAKNLVSTQPKPLSQIRESCRRNFIGQGLKKIKSLIHGLHRICTFFFGHGSLCLQIIQCLFYNLQFNFKYFLARRFICVKGIFFTQNKCRYFIAIQASYTPTQMSTLFSNSDTVILKQSL
jgi:hypothetical protein